MEFSFDTISNFLNSSTGGKLVDSVLGKKSSPAAPPSPAVSPVISVANPAIPSGMSTSTMMMIGGAVLAVVVGLFVAFRK